MKRYCLVSFCNIYVLPYAKLYIDAIKNAGAECDLVYWDRDALNGANDHFDGCNKICYNKKITPESSAKDKLFGYINARRFFLSKLKEKNYDGVVFLQTHAAVACKNVLTKKYKGKYIVDVRDFTLENYSLYRKMEQKVLAYAYSTVISSPAYKNFLPDGDFVIAHNFSPFPEAKVEQIRNSQKDEKKDPIRISFVGTVRFIEMDKKILRLFAGDERFCIQYFGTGSQVLEKFCKEEKIENVAFYGSFTPEMTMTFYEKTDLINNLYGNHTPFLDYALSNKLYHSGQLYIPILVCPETYMQDVSLQYDMGFVFDVDKAEDKDRLYDWYRKELDFDKLARGCDNFICSVKKDNEKFSEMLANFFK